MKYTVTLTNGDEMGSNDLLDLNDRVDTWVEGYIELTEGGRFSYVDFEVRCHALHDIIMETLVERL